jgi:hypothetical protein
LWNRLLEKQSTCDGAIGTFDQEDSMKTFALAVAAAAVVTLSAFANPAKAITLSGSDGMRHAIEDTDLTDKVHCRPGRPHHLRRWGWWDGCYRYNYFYSYPRFRSHRVYRGNRVHISRSFVHTRSGISRSHISRGSSRSHGRRR